MIYRAELSKKVFGQLGNFPPAAFDALVRVMSWVIEYPDDPLRSFPTADPATRIAEFGGAGLVTFEIDDARQVVTLTDVTWAG